MKSLKTIFISSDYPLTKKEAERLSQEGKKLYYISTHDRKTHSNSQINQVIGSRANPNKLVDCISLALTQSAIPFDYSQGTRYGSILLPTNNSQDKNVCLDFDHTLFNPGLLTEKMLQSLATYISSHSSNVSHAEVLQKLKANFNREHFSDIYELLNHFSTIYSYNSTEAATIIDGILLNCEKYLYSDTIPFLEELHKSNVKIHIVTYNEKHLEYQFKKIMGSGIANYVDTITITTVPKGEIPFDYFSCKFVDDKPKDLELLQKHYPSSGNVFRVKRR